MEEISINGRKWQKYIGDEGQDVYVALFAEDKQQMLGKYASEEDYDILVDRDADFYLPPNCDVVKSAVCDHNCIKCLDESRVAFKFRKNVFTPEEQLGAFEGLYDAAIETNNRGMAAGPKTEKSGRRKWVSAFEREVLEYYKHGQPQNTMGTDPIDGFIEKYKGNTDTSRGQIWVRGKIEKEFDGEYDDFFPIFMERIKDMSVNDAIDYAKRIEKEGISGTSYASPLWSGIAGFYGRYPRIPYGRATAYTDHHFDVFEKCYPFARKLDKEFARLLPERYGVQSKYAEKLDNKFLIGEDTTFTTITVNTTTHERNARMACHTDAGSLNAGFSNLTVVTKDGKSWKGGYLVAPEVRAAINVRPGDLLLIDNMRVIHGNTPIEPPDSGEEDMLRMSLVFYFREDMENLGSWEYENYRREFVNDRKHNKEHKFWKPYWNGVSPSMFDDQEWYDYLEGKGGKEMVMKYHPTAYDKAVSLEDFF